MRRLLALTLLLLSTSAVAEERIRVFHSDITVLEDGSMKVAERIEVNAEGNKIKRGIYRDFPTRYEDRFGNNYRVGFEIIGVYRNGTSEPFHTETLSNGIRIYIGSKNIYLNRGVYIYRIVYKTSRQLGFFEKHDELYWNVTGNDWDFTIERATARVRLPGSIPSGSITAEAYTGPAGSKAQDYTSRVDSDGAVFFSTTRPLPPKHGLTIVVGWPKGIVTEPTSSEKMQYLFRDNRHLLVATVGMAILLLYYGFVWRRVGRDPEAGVIIPRYEPPKGYSPASMRYIEQMGYDKTCFASAIINLAVKGYLKIEEDRDKDYVLTKTGEDVEMAPGGKALVKNLFGTAGRIVLRQSNHATISKALEAHQESLERNYEKLYFLTNTGYFSIGVILTIGILLATFIARPDPVNPAALFMLLWLTFWSLGVIMIVKQAANAWLRAKRNFIALFPAVFLTLFALPFVGAEVFVAYQLIVLTSWSLAGVVLVAVLINWLFYELLKAPTLAGRKLLDKIEGFKRYIDLAEKHELDYKHPKGRCPELFEAYLPYALALGVEQKWGEQFADVLAKAGTAGQAYSPRWYYGSDWNSNNIGDFSSSLGSSFASAVASSSMAPGSSSGGGGGGFSGGGGGGGGGGGW